MILSASLLPRLLAALGLLPVLALPASAGSWKLDMLENPLPTETFAEAGRAAPQSGDHKGLPDGRIATPDVQQDIVEAWYSAPTERYRHGALGDVIEGGDLSIRTASGALLSYDLPEDRVFEDRTPRLVDLDGDGKTEVIAIVAFARAGGAVGIYGIEDGKLVERAVSAPIGRSNRWLNIAGIADFAGLGRQQIAYVETPHIGGTLKVLDWQGDRLEVIAATRGFSNHRNGAREQRLSAVVEDQAGPVLVVPSDTRSTLRMMQMSGGQWRELATLALPGQLKTLLPLSVDGASSPCLIAQLETGETARICKNDGPTPTAKPGN